MKKEIYLVRHGEVDNPEGLFYGRIRDVSLNDEGKKQIERLGLDLQQNGTRLAAVYTSPLLRTRQTAEILAHIMGVKVVGADHLLEVDIKGFEGMTLSDVDALGDYHASPPRGSFVEDAELIAQRFLEHLRLTLQKHPTEPAALVSHGDPLAFAFQKLLYPNMPIPSILELRQKNYLAKGQAWKVTFGDDDQVVRYNLIG